MPLGQPTSLEDLEKQNAANFQRVFGDDPRAAIREQTLTMLEFVIAKISDDADKQFYGEVKRILELNRELTDEEKTHLKIFHQKSLAYALANQGSITIGAQALTPVSQNTPSAAPDKVRKITVRITEILIKPLDPSLLDQLIIDLDGIISTPLRSEFIKAKEEFLNKQQACSQPNTKSKEKLELLHAEQAIKLMLNKIIKELNS